MEIYVRSLRRHHFERLKAKRKNYYGGSDSLRFAGKVIHTATLCSCYSCGNSRRHDGSVTLDEASWAALHKLDAPDQG